MKADITRSTFDNNKHYRKVNVQQGRVQTDADWNEQADIQIYHERTFLKDIIGRIGAPTNNAGFNIIGTWPIPGYKIGAGHYYVDGILCENEQDIESTDQQDLKPLYFGWNEITANPQESKRLKIFLKRNFSINWIDSERVQITSLNEGRRLEFSLNGTNKISITLDNEPSKATKATLKDERLNGLIVYEFLVKNLAGKPTIGYTPALPAGFGFYLAYLDVWERHLTWLDDPEIREVALGGPDTTTRTKTVWQVKLLRVSVPDGEDSEDLHRHFQFPEWDELVAESTVTLQARAKPTEPANEPCELPPQAGYRGPQNQLYRVEIHDGGEANNGATFKWSRENGAVVARVVNIVNSENKIFVNDTGRDSRLGFAPLQWIELIDDRRELLGIPGTIVQLDSVTNNNTLIFKPGTIIGEDITNDHFPQELNPKVRRWDSDCVSKVTTPDENDGYIELEDGVQIKFSVEGTCKPGDHWIIPARTMTRDIEWKRAGNDPAAVPPVGIIHHFGRLALLRYFLDDEVESMEFYDWRQFFTPATALTLHYVSGDGQEAPKGNNLPSPLKALVSTGDKPVEGVQVEFRIEIGNGVLHTPSVDSAENLYVTSDADGIASCNWTLGDNPITQRVKATLIDPEGNKQPNLLPVYYSANIKPIAVATTGIIELIMPDLGTADRPDVIFGTFHHYLEDYISSPPAIVLGLAPYSATDNKVIFMEDYKFYLLKGQSVHLEFKAINVDLQTFKISVPTHVLTALHEQRINIRLRWWAISALEEDPQQGTVIDTYALPTIEFIPALVEVNQPTRVQVFDGRANSNPTVQEKIKIQLRTEDPNSGSITIEATEVDQNSSIFETEDIKVLQDQITVGGGEPFDLPGASAGRKIIATYITAFDNYIKTAELIIIVVNIPDPG